MAIDLLLESTEPSPYMVFSHPEGQAVMLPNLEPVGYECILEAALYRGEPLDFACQIARNERPDISQVGLYVSQDPRESRLLKYGVLLMPGDSLDSHHYVLSMRDSAGALLTTDEILTQHGLFCEAISNTEFQGDSALLAQITRLAESIGARRASFVASPLIGEENFLLAPVVAIGYEFK